MCVCVCVCVCVCACVRACVHLCMCMCIRTVHYVWSKKDYILPLVTAVYNDICDNIKFIMFLL